ncbi:MAG TPA: GNAT family N-acetyltransferase [Pyrinomonadaceae bacterium]|nr:GNAT family N-acetyltransferase [Pyrinomonadaceae bacterium]
MEPVIRECTSIEDFDTCISLQREAFGLPDLEISPRRHLIVSRQAGGWTLGAFDGDRMVGFVHHLAAVSRDNEVFGYSHMMAVAKDYQNKGIGARLKWAQRERALGEGRDFIKWTWDPMQSRNAHFNLNRLGVVVEAFGDNFYGMDYNADPTQEAEDRPGLQSDRLFASWRLNSDRVRRLAAGEDDQITAKLACSIAVPSEWSVLVKADVVTARREQARVRSEFKNAFAEGLICAAFERGRDQSKYLLFDRNSI